MSVTFHRSRDLRSPYVACLEGEAVARLNAALAAAGAGFEIDPWGDTKLTDHHIGRLLALPRDALDDETAAALEALKPLEVVYALGD